MTKSIFLTKGKSVLVDAADFDALSEWKWHFTVVGYAARNKPYVNGKGGVIYMHREINSTPKGMVTDHMNGDKLDNRRCNLRACSVSQNVRNQHVRVGGTSRFKGVNRNLSRWRARILVGAKQKHLGLFDTQFEAANAYNEAAIKYYGEFARINVLDGRG